MPRKTRGRSRRLPVIGASDGQVTQFIYVEVTSGDVYHGRPVTRKKLGEMGVRL